SGRSPEKAADILSSRRAVPLAESLASGSFFQPTFGAIVPGARKASRSRTLVSCPGQASVASADPGPSAKPAAKQLNIVRLRRESCAGSRLCAPLRGAWLGHALAVRRSKERSRAVVAAALPEATVGRGLHLGLRDELAVGQAIAGRRQGRHL